MVHIDVTSSTAEADTRRELSRIAPLCHWTSGTWDELGLPWDELQNVSKHISALSNYLARAYVAARKEQS
jgi:hypothetical protein